MPLFLVVLILTALSLAGSAAFFSIYGLAHIFSGAFWSVIFMGASLEAGKLVAASFLYRYWNKIGKLLKTYLFCAIFILMVITSMGIFGFLSAAYQTDTIAYKEVETKLSSLEAEKDELTKRKTAIDKQISDLPADYVTAKQRLTNTFKGELQHINTRLPQITSDIQQLRQQKIQVQAHTGPITYIASAFGLSIDDATKWIVFLLIIVFDPLAVVLTLAINIVTVDRSKTKDEPKIASQEVPITNTGLTVEKSEPPAKVFLNPRYMDQPKTLTPEPTWKITEHYKVKNDDPVVETPISTAQELTPPPVVEPVVEAVQPPQTQPELDLPKAEEVSQQAAVEETPVVDEPVPSISTVEELQTVYKEPSVLPTEELVEPKPDETTRAPRRFVRLFAGPHTDSTQTPTEKDKK